MIKLIVAVSKKAGWSNEEWFTHHAERHGPLAASVRACGLHTRRYVQNYALLLDRAQAIVNHATWLNGISELWFDNVQEFNAAYAEPDYMRVLRPDELRFCDLANLIGGVASEHQIVAEPEDSSDKR